MRFSLVERARTDQPIERLPRQPGNGGGRARRGEQRARHRQRDFVIRADRNDAGQELLEGRRETFVGQLEQGGFRPGLHGGLDAFECQTDIERLLFHLQVLRGEIDAASMDSRRHGVRCMPHIDQICNVQCCRRSSFTRVLTAML